MTKHARIALAAALALAFQAGAYAQTAQPAPSSDSAATTTMPTTTRGESPNYLERVAPKYSDFAGSEENLRSLVTGLRNASEITLAAPGITESLSFTPPTRPMGYGNITRALDLASRQLAAAGITNPTPEQLQAALMGGTVTTANGDITMQGVLTLRSESMGWGKIARTLGVPPNAHASANRITTPLSGGTARAGTQTGAESRGSGLNPAYSSGERVHGGITTPLGPVGTISAGYGRGNGNAYGHGGGALRASAAASSALAPSSAAPAGNGAGHAYGRAGR